jgi:predicted nucleic acid-binding Zn ribbon protein
MAIYEYACYECYLMWECDFPFGKPMKKTPCPECGAECGQQWAGRDIPVHFKGAGWSQATGYNKQGGSDEIAGKLMDETEDRMTRGWSAYGKYTPSKAWLESKGARRLNDQEVTEKLDDARKRSAINYDKAGINPYDKYKPQ